jgi:transposase
MVAVLGHSRRPAIRMATCCTREVSFERLVRCLDDLGGVTREILTDRDTVFWISASGTLSPEWVDLCGLLGTVPRLCRPYRPKTKAYATDCTSCVRSTEETSLARLGAA